MKKLFLIIPLILAAILVWVKQTSPPKKETAIQGTEKKETVAAEDNKDTPKRKKPEKTATNSFFAKKVNSRSFPKAPSSTSSPTSTVPHPDISKEGIQLIAQYQSASAATKKQLVRDIVKKNPQLVQLTYPSIFKQETDAPLKSEMLFQLQRVQGLDQFKLEFYTEACSQDQSEEVRLSAIAAIAFEGTKEGAKLMTTLLDDPSPTIREEAQEALQFF